MRCQYRTGHVRDIFIRCPDRIRRFALILIYAPITVRRGSGYRGGRVLSLDTGFSVLTIQRDFIFLGVAIAIKITRFISLLEIPVHLACGVYLMALVHL